MDLGAALTTNIDPVAILSCAASGAMTVMAAPAVIGAFGAGLTGVGLMTGSTTLFSAGLGVTEAAGAAEAAIYGISRAATEVEAASAEPWQCAEGKAAHKIEAAQRLAQTPAEEQPFVDQGRRFTLPSTGERFDPDYVNHLTGEVIEDKPLRWEQIEYLRRSAEAQLRRYLQRLSEMYVEQRVLDGASEYWSGGVNYYGSTGEQ